MNIITTLLFDLGGVVLSNGWDFEGRKSACDNFKLNFQEMEKRHDKIFKDFEKGNVRLDEYINQVVFNEERDFKREEFIQYMKNRSSSRKAAIEILEKLAAGKKYFMATINNESYELNLLRIRQFGLHKYFSAFFSSGFLGTRKPEGRIFQIALNVLQKNPSECLFIDDKTENVEEAQRQGINTIHLDQMNNLKKYLLESGISI